MRETGCPGSLIQSLMPEKKEKKSLEDKTFDCYYVTAILSQSLEKFTQLQNKKKLLKFILILTQVFALIRNRTRESTAYAE